MSTTVVDICRDVIAAPKKSAMKKTAGEAGEPAKKKSASISRKATIAEVSEDGIINKPKERNALKIKKRTAQKKSSGEKKEEEMIK